MQNYKNGRMPSADHLIRIRETFNIDLNWLLTGEGEMYLEETLPPPAIEPGTLRNLESRMTIIEEVLSRQIGEHRRRWYDKKITVEN